MKKNIVFYGDSNHGKSTLVGYIITILDKWKESDFSKREMFFRGKFGQFYRPDLFYTWIINRDNYKSKEIIHDLTGEKVIENVINEPGESLNNYSRTFLIDLQDSKENITFYDTPGQRSRVNIRDEALAIGDIGIFCVEIGEVLKDSFNEKHFEDFEIWTNFVPKAKPIILLTKTDKYLNKHKSEVDYNEASERIKRYGKYNDDIIIIPVAVLVDERRSYNIFNKANETPWYSGILLFDAIKYNIQH